MRLRHIPGSEDFVANSHYVLSNPEQYKGAFSEKLFGNTNPLHIEIGMGKGQFIFEMAKRNPEINYIGIERYDSVLLKAIQRREKQEPELTLTNLFYISIDARLLTDVFAPEEIGKIYLNFSDPWPKKRQANRRLSSPVFLKIYKEILAKDAFVEMKTDNQDLFTYSLESLEECHWQILASTRDLHHDSVLNEGNVMTEYEEKFSSKGNPICKFIAKP